MSLPVSAAPPGPQSSRRQSPHMFLECPQDCYHPMGTVLRNLYWLFPMCPSPWSCLARLVRFISAAVPCRVAGSLEEQNGPKQHGLREWGWCDAGEVLGAVPVSPETGQRKPRNGDGDVAGGREEWEGCPLNRAMLPPPRWLIRGPSQNCCLRFTRQISYQPPRRPWRRPTYCF